MLHLPDEKLSCIFKQPIICRTEVVFEEAGTVLGVMGHKMVDWCVHNIIHSS